MIANNGRRVNGKAGKIEIMLQNAHKRPLDESDPQAVKKPTESSRGPKPSRIYIVPGGVVEPHPVKRTEKKYKDYPVGSQELPAAFQAARQRACFSKGVRTLRLR